MPFPVSTSAEVRALDAHTIQNIGVASLALMELAGRAVASEILVRFEPAVAKGVLILAGRGNNGGDGYVMARMLHARGFRVWVVGLEGNCSPDCEVNRQAALRAGVCVQGDLPELSWIRTEIGLVVDALLGTGLKSDLRSPLSTWVDVVNALELPVVAVDLPTGLCGDTGRVHGTAIQADITVCLGRAKLGCFLEPGADFSGEVVLANIGLLGNVDPTAEIVCGAWVAERLPIRSKNSHKNSHGHLGVIAGSLERAGAAILTCNAALAAGCGLVTLIIHPDAVHRLGQLGPEIMVLPSEDPAQANLSEFSALAVGPGLGTDDASLASLLALWKEAEQPAVFDADGLSALVGHFEKSAFSRCITPHPGEAGRLLERTNAEIQSDRLGAVRALAKIAPTLLKGRNTLISNGGTAPIRINPTGTSALATAGTGDVLTGIVGAFLAQGIAPFESLTMAAFIHGWAAERVARPHLAAGELNLVLGEAMATVADRDPVLSARSLVSA
jgi:NAD(P)H-hydrate epimerase